MRRFTSFFGITLLALLVSGWGNVLAATLCPHVMGAQANVEKAASHQHDSPQQAMGGMQMTHASESGHCASKVAAFDQPAGICTHCLSRNEFPATASSLRELTLKKRDAGTIVRPAASAATSLAIVYTPQFLPTQNAPPGPSNRKHLLVSVFLI
ncbi:MAG TPA: hypothetical protein VGN95_13265 [Pyrinomonadaceae bacterium]|jgi:hypothetical protein|nr:hypothetical protein [Pyrinomonadaceae bacterium]